MSLRPIAGGCAGFLLVALISCGPGSVEGPDAQVAEAEVASPRKAADPFAGAEASRLRGRVVDRVTGQPWGDVWVRLEADGGRWTVLADAGGHFLAPVDLAPGAVRLAVGLDEAGPWCSPGVQEVAHEPEAAVLHRLRVAPGPEQALRFLEPAMEHAERFEARLVEVAADGTFHPWSWQVLRPGETPRLRYLEQEREPDAGRVAWIELHQRGRDWFGRARLPALRGGPDSPVEVPLVQYGTVGGQVRDTTGRPLRECAVRLYPEVGSEAPLLHRGPRVTRTDEDGRFRFDGVEPGHHDLELRPEGRPRVRVHVDCEGGQATGSVYEVEPLAGAAELPVAVVGESEDEAPQAILALRSVEDAPGVVRVLHTRARGGWREQLEAVGLGHAGLFTELPPVRYELRVLGLDARRQRPERWLLEAPSLGEGAVIEGSLPEGLQEWRPRVLLGDDELEGFRARLSAPGWWYPLGREVAAGEVVGWLGPEAPTPLWTLWVDGARPARGDASSWRDAESVPEVVRLEPGWGVELVLRDASRARLPLPDDDTWLRTGLVASAPPLVDVEVFADGKRLGRTDADGRFFLSLERPPVRLELRREGWRALDPGCTGEVDRTDNKALARAGTAVVWMEPLRD